MTTSRKQIIAGIVFGLVGFAANRFKLELFFGVDYLFGSFFVMLAMLQYGGLAGIIAGAVASLYTWFHWHHPWAIVSFTGEALFVAWWLRTRSREAVLSALIYWLVAGAPFLWCSYHYLLGMPAQSTLLVMLKQSVNGIMNALAATLAIQAFHYRYRKPDGLLTLEKLFATIIMAFVLIPALLYLTLETGNRVRDEEERIVAMTVRIAEEGGTAVQQWIEEHHRNVIILARLVGDPATTPIPVMQERVEAMKLGSLDFLRLSVFDRQAVSVAVAPLSGIGAGRIGIDVSDRPYLTELRKLRAPMVGDIVISRVGAPEQILPLVAPILIDGDFRGFCAGVIDPAVLQPLLKTHLEDAGQVTLVDGVGRIITSTRTDVRPMSPFLRPSGWTARPMAEGVTLWSPRLEQAPSAMQRWRSSLYVKELAIGPKLPWKVIVEVSPVPMLNTLSLITVTVFSLMLALMVVTVLFARVISRALVLPLSRLMELGNDLPRHLAEENPALPWPESGITEVKGLIDNFRNMADKLNSYLHELRRLNRSLEDRVAERTASLEERTAFLTGLLHSLPDYVFFKDCHCVYLGGNPALARLLGRSPDTIAGATDYDFFSPDVAAMLQANDRDILATGQTRTFHETLLFPGKTTLPVETVKAPMTLSSGEIIGLVGVARDITERLRHEDELVRARQVAEGASQAKSRFLAVMSHELRTPLSAVLGHAEMLRLGIHGEMTPEQQRGLKIIEESGRHLLEVISDILDLAKIEADRIGMEFTADSLEDVCRSSLQLIREAAQRKGQAVTLTLHKIPEIFRTDQRRLKQVLVNLLSNAVKFTPEGGKVGLEVTGDPQRREVRLTVWDTGIGIAAEDLETLFQPFVQVDTTLSRRYEGTGLGLALVAKFVDLLGGSVTATSELHRGSRFIVTLPWREDTAPPGSLPQPRMPAPTPAVIGGGLILLVDDSLSTREMTAEYLRAKGHDVITAGTGTEAVALAGERRFDLILMDIQMPEMDGLEAIRRIRNLPRQEKALPIIALTALVMPGDRERCQAAGADVYLAKPISLGELSGRINELLAEQEVSP